jgi:hypothetical protein
MADPPSGGALGRPGPGRGGGGGKQVGGGAAAGAANVAFDPAAARESQARLHVAVSRDSPERPARSRAQESGGECTRRAPGPAPESESPDLGVRMGRWAGAAGWSGGERREGCRGLLLGSRAGHRGRGGEEAVRPASQVPCGKDRVLRGRAAPTPALSPCRRSASRKGVARGKISTPPSSPTRTYTRKPRGRPK